MLSKILACCPRLRHTLFLCGSSKGIMMSPCFSSWLVCHMGFVWRAELEEGGPGGEVESLELETAAQAGIPRREWEANPDTPDSAGLTSVLRTNTPEKHSEGPVRTFPFWRSNKLFCDFWLSPVIQLFLGWMSPVLFVLRKRGWIVLASHRAILL